MSSNTEFELLFHLGAHKTASTHFERETRFQIKKLKNENVRHLNKQLFRTTYRKYKKFWNYNTHQEIRTELCLHKYSDTNFRKLLIFDENILGGPRKAFKKGIMYPIAIKQVSHLMKMVGSHKTTFSIAIRNPAFHIPSIYCESIRSSGIYTPFKKYIGKTDITSFSWSALIRQIKNTIGDATLIVWTYEKYNDLLPDLINLYLDNEIDKNSFNPIHKSPIRVGLSEMALNEIKISMSKHSLLIRLLSKKTIRLSKEKIDTIMSRYPKSEKYPGIKLFNQEQIDMLSDNYKQDIQTISEMKDVVFID